MNDLLDLLVGDWNVYAAQTHWAQTQTYPLRPRVRNKENLGQMERMTAWCRENRIEPRLWLYFLFKRSSWQFIPKFTDGALMSAAGLAKFKRMRTGLGFFHKRMAASAVEADGTRTFDPNVDVSDTVEALKRRYVHGGPGVAPNPERCLDEQIVNTLGWHPKSEVCQGCPLAAECAMRLEASVPFPILALRAGRLTVAQALDLADPPKKVRMSDAGNIVYEVEPIHTAGLWVVIREPDRGSNAIAVMHSPTGKVALRAPTMKQAKAYAGHMHAKAGEAGKGATFGAKSGETIPPEEWRLIVTEHNAYLKTHPNSGPVVQEPAPVQPELPPAGRTAAPHPADQELAQREPEKRWDPPIGAGATFPVPGVLAYTARYDPGVDDLLDIDIDRARDAGDAARLAEWLQKLLDQVNAAEAVRFDSKGADMALEAAFDDLWPKPGSVEFDDAFEAAFAEQDDVYVMAEKDGKLDLSRIKETLQEALADAQLPALPDETLDHMVAAVARSTRIPFAVMEAAKEKLQEAWGQNMYAGNEKGGVEKLKAGIKDAVNTYLEEEGA